MKRTVRPRLVRVMMDAGHELMTARFVVIFTFEMCQVVLRFLRDGTHPPDQLSFLCV